MEARQKSNFLIRFRRPTPAKMTKKIRLRHNYMSQPYLYYYSLDLAIRINLASSANATAVEAT